ncbi:hypothetical protein [Gordonia zhaorongruii]|uniref:hypothetical protein n=1 Tax=Gordonia zhaorongruii TaxID=2597659 RepID=UPI00104C118F|nr:hypothetical protein [Gordonia zhaorongruii]
MRNRIRTTTRIAAAGIATTGLIGAGIAAGDASADGFPNGPYCAGPAKILAESNWSQVAICPVQGPTGWEYSAKAKSTGDRISLRGPIENQYGFHVSNDGYDYHVHPDRLLIIGPNGETVANEAWTYYVQR